MSSSAVAVEYAPGATVGGKYRLECMLGEGGMGSVWKAHHEKLDTAVAIKLIRADTNRQDMALRLVQEARAAAKLGHPAIVRVFDVGQTDQGDPFIVMELLEGESLLERLLRDGRLPATDAVKLLLPIADALRAAHARGIVHRDIKPDNVFITVDKSSDSPSVQPKLVDFGIAKLEKHDISSHLTQKGVVLGSPDYMSPEQARGESDIDHRSDIWSFCVLLYEVIGGKPPFDGENYNALLRAIVETRASTLEEVRAADGELSTIIATGMTKERAGRWRSMQALGEALALWLLKQGVFEDAAGGSIEAKWILRRSDPGLRQSRPSLDTLPGLGQKVARSTSTTERHPAEEPPSIGGVVTGTGTHPHRRLIVPILVAVALVAFAAFSTLPTRPARAPKAAAPPSSSVLGPTPPVPVTAPPAPATAMASHSEPKEPAPRPVEAKFPKARPKSAASSASARPASNPKADLMSPY